MEWLSGSADFYNSEGGAAIIYGFCAGQSLSAFYWVNTFWGLWACWILTPFAWHALRKTY